MIKKIEAGAAASLAAAGMVQLVDATWQLPGDTPLRGYLAGTSASVNAGAIKALEPSMRPAASAKVFADDGVTGQKPVCVYDRANFFSAPWVAWLLAGHGHAVSLVQGWGDEGPLSQTESTDRFSKADPTRLNIDKAGVLQRLGSETQIVDARSAARFAGEASEPRYGSRTGHIPGSLNLPFGTIRGDSGYIDMEDIAEKAARAGIATDRPIVTTCGSGVTASALAIALQRIGAEDVRVYQGSWAEWGSDETLPIETGA